MKLKIVEEKKKITNDWSIESVAKEYPPRTWEEVFKNAENEIQDVSEILKHEKILPDKINIFRAFHLTPLNKVKVVIFGQDPYPSLLSDGNPLATGMAFSIPNGAPIPSSLRNIYKEVKDSIPDFKTPNHGDLTSWALQGILLLNSSLTVRQGEAGCHKEIWNGFIKKVINAILNINPDCIFVAWGNNAQKIANKFVGERATILAAAHPSGLSCHKGFFGCKHFLEINNLLQSKGKELINWNL